MTANARDRLDPAVLRSGRIDYEVEFTNAEPEQIERLFILFYSDFSGTHVSSPSSNSQATEAGRTIEDAAPLCSDSSANAFAAEFVKQISASGVQLTTADVQRHLMKRKKDPARALKELAELFASHTGAAIQIVTC